MTEYHKIHSIFKRPEDSPKFVIEGDWSLPAFGYLAFNEWEFTEKVDGTNIRVIIEPGVGQQVRFGGKTDNAAIPAKLIERLQERFLPQVERLVEVFPDGGCLYGEGYGAKIQKGGGNYRADQDFVLFDVRVGEWWLERENIEDVAGRFGLEVVPVIGRGTLFTAVTKAKEGITSTWGDFLAEGIVARPTVELKTRSGHRVITKIKTKDFRR